MDKEEIKQAIMNWFEKNRPFLNVEDFGASELLINGKRLDLENVFRMCAHAPDKEREVMEHYLEQFFPLEEGDALFSTWALASPRIFPRIQPVSIFSHLNRELVAHVPYVQDTVIVFVTDLPNMTVSLTTQQMVHWGKELEDLYKVAIENLERSTEEMEMQAVESKEGGKAVLIAAHDGYDAARLLLPGLHSRLSETLGAQFLVAIPARDMFIALTPHPAPFVSRLRQRVALDHGRLPYPISADFFCVTQDGVSATTELEEMPEAPLDPNNPLDKQILETIRTQEDALALLAKLYEQRRQQRSA